MSSKYWATGKNTQVVKDLGGDWYLEYNHSIGMYRLNRKKGPIPLMYMGYSPHKAALVKSIKRG